MHRTLLAATLALCTLGATAGASQAQSNCSWSCGLSDQPRTNWSPSPSTSTSPYVLPPLTSDSDRPRQYTRDLETRVEQLEQRERNRTWNCGLLGLGC